MSVQRDIPRQWAIVKKAPSAVTECKANSKLAVKHIQRPNLGNMCSANLAMTLSCEVQPPNQFCRAGACGEGGAQRAMQAEPVTGSRHTGSRLA